MSTFRRQQRFFSLFCSPQRSQLVFVCWCVVQCSVISPRFDVKMKDLEHWTAYLLPSRQFGYVTTCSLVVLCPEYHLTDKRRNPLWEWVQRNRCHFIGVLFVIHCCVSLCQVPQHRVAYQAMKNKLRGVNYISSSSSWLFGSRCCETLLLPLSILSAEFFMAGTETLSDDWTVSTHTHTRLTAIFPWLPGWAGTRKVKPIWIILKQETVSGSSISWAICKSASRSRQITMPAPHHSVFYRPDALPVAQPTASKHWRYLDSQYLLHISA